MSEKRIAQVNELLKRELNQIIQKEIEIPFKSLATIVKVEVSADLNFAKVWVSVFPVESQEETLKILDENLPTIQQRLNERLVMKFVPKISFKLDQTEAKAERINLLLDKIKKKG